MGGKRLCVRPCAGPGRDLVVVLVVVADLDRWMAALQQELDAVSAAVRGWAVVVERGLTTAGSAGDTRGTSVFHRR